MLKVAGQILSKSEGKFKDKEGKERTQYSMILLNTGSKFNHEVRVKEDFYKESVEGEDVEIDVAVFPYVTKAGTTGYNMVQI